MKTVRSSVIGYCFGVANSIEKAEEAIRKAGEMGLPCYSIGEIIHNKDVVNRFEKMGMTATRDCDSVKPGVAVIRAHGIPDRLRRRYADAGFMLIDSTCPIVAKGAVTLRKAASTGCRTIIIGVRGHAETVGLQGVEDADGNAVESRLVTCMEDAQNLVDSGVFDTSDQIVVVVQTTFSEKEFLAIRKYLKGVFPKIRFSNSPCGATIARNKAVLQLAAQTDAVIVIGGKASENTRGLARKVAETGKPVFSIENEKDLDGELLRTLSGFSSVGICSGSSTPTSIIRAVEEILEDL